MSNVSNIDAKLAQALEHMQAGRLAEAEAICRGILAILPDQPDTLHAMGLLRARARDFSAAKELFVRTVHLRPDFVEAHSNLGNVLRELDDPESAIAAYRDALKLQPKAAPILSNLSVALVDAQRLEEGISTAREAIALAPDWPQGHCNLGHFLLLKGDFEHGWVEYEWRWKVPNLLAQRLFDRPRLADLNVAGKTILLHCEQGVGDAIQFARFIEPLALLGAQTILECPPTLFRLMQTCSGISKIFTAGEGLPPHDVQAPLMSLAGVFKAGLRTIPKVPYLKSSRNRISNDALRVGLCWSGSPIHRNDRNRSIPMEAFDPLADVEGVEFYSLQPITGASRLRITDPTRHIFDFADTADFMQNLDLIVTVDTAVAHLAGALGRPIWTLLPFAPDWRWMLGRDDSPWYPTMRLFRQPARGDWRSVIRNVCTEMGNLLDRKTGRA